MRAHVRFAGLAIVIALALSGCWMNARGGPGNSGVQPLEVSLNAANVGTLTLEWQGSTDSNDLPLVSDLSHVFTAGSVIHAYRNDGGADCSGLVCIPDWNYSTGAQIVPPPVPALSGGSVFSVVPGDNTLKSSLKVYPEQPDATCSAAPVFCDSIWTANLPTVSDSSPVVANGRVYVATATGFSVFDAAGVTGCSGTPKTCQPLWTGAGQTSRRIGLSVANGHIYLPTEGNRILVFDDAGADGCSGSPTICTPQFKLSNQAVPNVSGHFGLAAVASDRVASIDGGTLYVFDATGSAGCSGTPKVCLPLWSAVGAIGVPAVTTDEVLVAQTIGTQHDVAAFNLGGGFGCAGTPVVCEPQWWAPNVEVNTFTGGPTEANGVVYLATTDNRLQAFDVTGCPGAGGVCAPIADVQLPAASMLPVVVAAGRVFVAGGDLVTAYSMG